MTVRGSASGPAALPVLFIGPSLSPEEIDAELASPADIRPPVRRGDFDRLDPAVRLAAVVDGVFLNEQAVSPREIMDALRRGVQVVGASSMGALRAAELARFGMEGVGEVYRMYATGEITSDADVALAFDPESSRALTVPVVNVIYMMRLAASTGLLSDQDARRIVDEARAIYFMDLTYRSLLARARAILPAPVVDRLAGFVAAHEVAGDLKRVDAILAIARLNELANAASGGRRSGD